MSRRGTPRSTIEDTTIKRMNVLEIGWLAGIIEGEGTFHRQYRKTGGGQIYIKVSMTDKDIITRLQEITGVGNITESQPKNPNHKRVYHWRVTRQSDCMHLLCSVVPLLGERRKEAVTPLVDFVLELAEKAKFCANGHLWDDESARYYKGVRYCKLCNRDKMRVRSAKRLKEA